MRTLVLFALAGLAGAPMLATAEVLATTQVLQQRTADGRTLLTDRPAAGAKTERSWQVEREDPAAARRRALDVQVEAQLVSERVERRMAQQQRLLDEDMQRRSQALERERERTLSYGDDPYAGGFVVFAPGRANGSYRQHGPRYDGRPGRDGRSSGGPRAPRFTGPAGPGNR